MLSETFLGHKNNLDFKLYSCSHLSATTQSTTTQLTSASSCLSLNRLAPGAPASSAPAPAPAPGTPVTHNCNAKRRKAEDKMAMIFVAIVTGFFVTNLPRILLDLHEILIFDMVVACTKARMQ